MDINTKMDKVRQVAEEIITEDDLRNLFETKNHPIAYDGFEPSGNVHIAQGLLRAININRITSTGIKFKMLVADWHAWANNKLGGDLEKIQATGEYMIELWKACGLDDTKIEYIWANDLVQDKDYWKKVMKISINSTVKRITRCSQIMGRSESDSLSASQILYPCMQCADIFELGADMTQLGMDQRKVNMLAREIGEKLGYYKPVVVSHHMLMGLAQPPKTEDAVARATAMKMSKSNPASAIFMTDTEEDVKKKINKAYCPEKTIEENPMLEYCKYIIFPSGNGLTIVRPEKWGGNKEYVTYAELENDFRNGLVHPADLKSAVSIEINKLLEPVRKHFERNKRAQKMLDEVKSFTITR